MKTRLSRHQFYNQNRQTIDKFHKAYYQSDVQSQTYWMGRKIVKCPLDVWVVQEILYETRPDLIIETGTFHGGSAEFYADILDVICETDGKTDYDPQILSIDIAYDDQFDYPNHPRIEFLLGMSSIDPAVLSHVAKAADGKRCMVILDSDHSCDHVLQELRAYHGFVTPDCYLVVEDTNVNGLPVMPLHGPGPMDAVRAWNPQEHGFEIDKEREKFLMSFHPSGWLKKGSD